MIKIVAPDTTEYTLMSGDTHGDIIEESAFEHDDVRQKFPGVQGEAELPDRTGGRDLVCEVTITAADSATLNSNITTNNQYLNSVRGTLVVSGGISASYGNVTFKGFVKNREGILRDVSQSRVYCRGILRFRQHLQD